jgi:hypothetical protein
MTTETYWRGFYLRKSEKEQIEKVSNLIFTYIKNGNLVDRFGINFINEKELFNCFEFWFLNPNSEFEKSLFDIEIKLSKTFPKDKNGVPLLD